MAWILLRPSNYKQVAPLVRTGGSRHTGLAALPHHNIHNGLSEGLNNKVKVLKRMAFGLHSFEGFRKRILLTCGKLRLSKDPLSVLEDARNGKEIRL